MRHFRATFVFLLFFVFSLYRAEDVRRRFEYKHSFRAPDLVAPDGKIVFWEVSGDAIASADRLRLAPSMQSKRGIAWNTKPMVEGEFWEVEMSLQVTGPGRLGADGLALWYTDTKGRLGNVFGASDYWRGLGVFFDSFDNDGQGNNPIILVMTNDGTKSFDHANDGGTGISGSCRSDFRNRPAPVKAKIQYYKNTMTVYVTDGLSLESQYELCCTVQNVILPRNGFFGLSAATGGIGDDHDIVSFNVYSLVSPEAKTPSPVLPVEDIKKTEEEYMRRQEEFEKEKERFRKEHPEKAATSQSPEMKYEDETLRQLRIIYQTQARILNKLNNMETAIIQGKIPQAPAGQVASVDTFTRSEVKQVLDFANSMSFIVKELRSLTGDISSRLVNVESRMQSLSSPQQQPQMAEQVLKPQLEEIKQSMERMRIAQATQMQSCMSQENCLSPSVFVFIIIVQSLVLAFVLIKKLHNEKTKFY